VESRYSLNLADDLLLYTDKITMHFALECRVPMLDHQFLNFVESLPIEYKIRFRKSKIIHKAFASEFLPGFIINRPKRGFLSPTKYWFNKHLNIISDILLSRNSALSTYFNLNAVENVLKTHQKGYNKEKQIFLLLSLYYWFRNSKNSGSRSN
jgi:asparagine synthase (glutamine-hydrolysing)